MHEKRLTGIWLLCPSPEKYAIEKLVFLTLSTQIKRSRLAEEQIIGISRQAEAGVRVVDLCRQNGIFDVTFYNCRSKFCGMNIYDAKRLRQLEAENAGLKRIFGEQVLDDVAHKEG